ncbi:MAG: alpha/beta hydrolase [Pyrinomonadaceae bacterium]
MNQAKTFAAAKHSHQNGARQIHSTINSSLASIALPLLLFIVLVPFTAQAQSVAAAARGETVQFQSKLIGKTLPYNVYLPSDYSSPATKATRYPVVYLLHGHGGHYNIWTPTLLADSATQFHLIIVTPEGNNSWYTDSATTATDKYETYILQEVIPDVERRYRAIAARDGRGIGGLSMGGYGALKFGIKHPEMFAYAASMSGALDAAAWTENDLKGYSPALSNSIMQAFGAAGSQTRAANDIYKMFRELPADRIAALPYFYLDCGTEDSLLRFSRKLDETFLTQKIPHEFRELPGAHNMKYWSKQIPELLRIAAQKMKAPAAQAANAAPSVNAAAR